MDDKRRPGWLVTVGIAVAAAIFGSTLTVTALAQTEAFSDIAGTAFQEEIGRIEFAGCASGFPDGTFRPRDPTTRGQFAFWTVNCGGRVHQNNQGNTALTVGTGVPVGTTVLDAGGTGDGIGYVWVQANVQVFTVDPSNCPCRVNLQIREVNSSATSAIHSLTVMGHASVTDVFENASLSMFYEADAGESLKFEVLATMATNNTTSFARSNTTAIYLPFFAVD